MARFLGIPIPDPPDSDEERKKRERETKRREREGKKRKRGVNSKRQQALIDLNAKPSSTDALRHRLPGSFESGKHR